MCGRRTPSVRRGARRIGNAAPASGTPKERAGTLRAEEVERYKAQSPGERAREALQVMRDGFALKRGNLRRQHPQASEDEIDSMLLAWMASD